MQFKERATPWLGRDSRESQHPRRVARGRSRPTRCQWRRRSVLRSTAIAARFAADNRLRKQADLLRASFEAKAKQQADEHQRGHDQEEAERGTTCRNRCCLGPQRGPSRTGSKTKPPRLGSRFCSDPSRPGGGFRTRLARQQRTEVVSPKRLLQIAGPRSKRCTLGWCGVSPVAFIAGLVSFVVVRNGGSHWLISSLSVMRRETLARDRGPLTAFERNDRLQAKGLLLPNLALDL